MQQQTGVLSGEAAVGEECAICNDGESVKHGDNRDLGRKVTPPRPKYLMWLRVTVNAFARLYPPPRSVLDVGARYGHGTDMLQAVGYDAYGIELLPEYVAEAHRCGRWYVAEMDITNTTDGGNYDAIFSRHCIEHTRSPELFFDGCSKHLHNGGALFLTFPIESKEKFDKRTPGNHLFRFEDKEHVVRCAESAGFKVKTICKSRRLGIPSREDEYCLVAEKC